MLNIFGDSHTRALLNAHKESQGLPATTIIPLISGSKFVKPFHEVTPQGIRFLPPQMQENFEVGFGRTHMAPDPKTVWGLCVSFHSARYFRAKTWDQFTPITLPRARKTPLSQAVLKQMAIDELQFALAFYEDLQKLGIQFFVVSAPAPPNHHRKIKANRTRDVAIHANQIYRNIVREALDERKVNYILPDPSTVQENGLLVPQYNNERPNDQHHANIAYGRLMLPKIIAFATELAPTAIEYTGELPYDAIEARRHERRATAHQDGVDPDEAKKARRRERRAAAEKRAAEAVAS